MPSKGILPIKQESITDLTEMSLVDIAKTLLEASVQSSDVLKGKSYTPESMKEARVVLGFLHALNTAYQTKLNAFKLVGMREKVAVLKKMKVK